MAEKYSAEHKESEGGVALEIREPERDKNFMIAFYCAEEGLCAAYNLAIEQILKKDDLSPFHQIGSRHEPGEHAWEVWTSMEKTELQQLLTQLLPEIESAAKENYEKFFKE